MRAQHYARPEVQEFIIPRHDDEITEDDEEEIHLSFAEFERLYKDGYITREQIRTGRVHKRDLQTIKAVLASDTWSSYSKSGTSEDEDDTFVNCGPKTVDSQRYNRDYVVNRSPESTRRRWKVERTRQSREAAEAVKATPAGQRERISLDEAEDQVGAWHGYFASELHLN